MEGTFTQIHIHIVFAVRHRAQLIKPEWENDLYKYISGIVRKKNQKLLAINGMPDHIHLLTGLKPNITISELVREIKKSTNTFINQNRFCEQTFHWQNGFSAFACSYRELAPILNYILHQKQHHIAKTFQQEHQILLEEHSATP